MAIETVVVDPVTRIEGHLRIEAKTDERGVITQASSAGTMVRGIEIILRGRDPREAWAFAQRICGVCTMVHGLASVRAVEDALKYEIPQNAQLIRNLMVAAQFVHDHVMHFYHLHALDWVDVVSALKADPAATSALARSISPRWPKSTTAYFADQQKRLKTFVEQGQLGLFANGYWGHPAYKLPPEANLMAVAHYFEALAWQRDAVQLHTVFGGKNPHPNFAVGGVPCAISLTPQEQAASKGQPFRGGRGTTAVDSAGLERVRKVIASMRDFVEQVYLPDVLAIASFYKDWSTQGEGIGNFLCYGDFPDPVSGGLFLPRGIILNRDLSRVQELDLKADDQIKEYVSHSWYDYSVGRTQGLHPYSGETKLNYTGPKPPYQHLDTDGSYSWMKSPRWRGKAMEVGPLARIALLYANRHTQTRELVDQSLRKLELPLTALYSTLGRTLARALETQLFVDAMQGWYDKLMGNIAGGDFNTFNDRLWNPDTWPRQCRGVGYLEAPRGALAHWIVIENGLIANYQAVVPSTWNAGPRDASGQDGPYEAALKGHRLHDARQPIEILRTIHSFDPCIACAVHVTDPQGEELVKVKVL